MNIRSVGPHDSLMAANEKTVMADRTPQPASAGTTAATSDRQTKLDTYTPPTGAPLKQRKRRRSIPRPCLMTRPLSKTTRPLPSQIQKSKTKTRFPLQTPSNPRARLARGANVNPDDIATPAAATKMIQDLKAIGGGTLRFQMTHDQIKDSRQLDKLRALLSEGANRV